jgi:branched-chain amino acid transport system substrate-binding protein
MVTPAVTTTAAGTTTTSAAPIKLGSMVPLTGGDASNGREMHRGLKLAVDEINAQGGLLGRPVELTELDTADMSSIVTLQCVDTLATKYNVDFVTYGYGATYTAAYEEFAKYELPFLQNDTCQEFADWVNNNPSNNWMGWMATTPEHFYGSGFRVVLDQIMASGAWKPKTKTVAVIRGEDSYGQRIASSFIDEIKKEGWSVTLDETASFGTVEYGPYLTKLRANPPDLLFTTIWVSSDYAAFCKQFFQDPTPSLMYGQWAPSAPEFISLLGDKANGIIWSTINGPLTRSGASYQDPICQTFYNKYKALYPDTEPGDQAFLSYDNGWQWATATMIAGTTDKKAVCQALSNDLRVYRGTTGSYRYNKEHWADIYPDEQRDVSIGIAHQHLQIRNGKHQLISPPPYASTQFELPWWIKQ